MAPLQELTLYYRTLGQLLEAGVPMVTALTQSAVFLPKTAVCGARVADGATLTQALADAPGVFPAAHLRLIAAGEMSGRIDAVLRQLAEFTEELQRMRSRVRAGLLLPAIVFHLGALIAPLPAWIAGGSFGGYLMSSVGFVAMVWIAGWLGLQLARRLPATVTDNVWRAVPWFRGLRAELEMWWLASGMGMLTRAGVGVIAALRECAAACRSPRTAAQLCAAAEQAEMRGEAVSGPLLASGIFPVDVMVRWKTGEMSGYLDDVFTQIARDYAQRTEMRLRSLAEWAPRVAYGIVALYMISQIAKLAGGLSGRLVLP